MEFTTTKRDRDGNQRVQWRHDPSRLERWKDLKALPRDITPRVIQRAVGVLIWDATISCRPLFEEENAINMLRIAAHHVLQARCKKLPKAWDTVIENAWMKYDKELTYLQDRVTEVINLNAWRELPPEPVTTYVIRAASDASGGVLSKNKADPPGTFLKAPAWGYVVMREGAADTIRSGSFPKDLRTSHIYLKELWTCVHTVEEICSTSRNVRIELGVDNTAVVGAVRGRYSSNRFGNELIKRLHHALRKSECTLDIVPLRSEDNPADAPSRGQQLRPAVREVCLDVMRKYVEGKVRVEPPPRKDPPTFNGELRHEEPDDILDDCLSDDEE